MSLYLSLWFPGMSVPVLIVKGLIIVYLANYPTFLHLDTALDRIIHLGELTTLLQLSIMNVYKYIGKMHLHIHWPELSGSQIKIGWVFCSL